MYILSVLVQKLPQTLPPIVLALLTGLNAAAVGLIALAAYKLSASTMTDGITHVVSLMTHPSSVQASRSALMCSIVQILFFVAAATTLYVAPWLFPVLTVSGGIATFFWDWKVRSVFLETQTRIRKIGKAHARKTSTLVSSDPTPSSAVGGTIHELRNVDTGNISPTIEQEEIQLDRPKPAGRDSSYSISKDPHLEIEDHLTPAIPSPVYPPAVTAPPLVGRLPTPPPDDRTDTRSIASNSSRRRRPPGNSAAISHASVHNTGPTDAVGDSSPTAIPLHPLLSIGASLIIVVLFFALLITVIVLASTLKPSPRALNLFSNMFLAGVIIFGGGPVVIPLLKGYTVDNGWASAFFFPLNAVRFSDIVLHVSSSGFPVGTGQHARFPVRFCHPLSLPRSEFRFRK